MNVDLHLTLDDDHLSAGTLIAPLRNVAMRVQSGAIKLTEAGQFTLYGETGDEVGVMTLSRPAPAAVKAAAGRPVLGPPARRGQLNHLFGLITLASKGSLRDQLYGGSAEQTRELRLAWARERVGREIPTFNALTYDEAELMIAQLGVLTGTTSAPTPAGVRGEQPVLVS